MNGTASSTAPGTRVATVTGIQTCCARRSICSISPRWTSRRIARASSATRRPEVARLAVQRQHGHQAGERVDVGDRRPLPERLHLGEPLADPAAHAGQVLAQAPEPRAARRLSAEPSE